MCWYPDGYVEPRPLFWQRIREIAECMQEVVAALPAEGELTYLLKPFPSFFEEHAVSVPAWKAHLQSFYSNFASCVVRLENLVVKKLLHEALSEADLGFIDGLIQAGGILGSGGNRCYDGLYPALLTIGAKTLQPTAQANLMPWSQTCTLIFLIRLPAILGPTFTKGWGRSLHAHFREPRGWASCKLWWTGSFALSVPHKSAAHVLSMMKNGKGSSTGTNSRGQTNGL